MRRIPASAVLLLTVALGACSEVTPTETATALGAAPLLSREIVAEDGPRGLIRDRIHGQLAVGNFHGCGITASGATWCWGRNVNGELGNGRFTSASAPVAVVGNPTFTEISAGGHTCGLLASGSALCWGRNNFGELGDGTANNRATPVSVAGGPWTTIASGRLTTCAITPANEAYCWGANQRGELGNPSIGSSRVPVPVTTSLRFARIAAGWTHTCALTSTDGHAGEAYCWGSGTSVGDGGTTDRATPARVAGDLTVTRLFAGGNHTCGLTATGSAHCWGVNGAGQLGDGSTIDRASPVTVSGGHAFIMLAAASRPIQPADLGKRSHTCGITTTGKAYCWGSNNVGQLGDGTTTDRLIPTAVSTSEVFAAIGAGDTFTCAMTPNRKVFCWGSNVLGELGSGNIGGFSTIPVAVPPPFR